MVGRGQAQNAVFLKFLISSCFHHLTYIEQPVTAWTATILNNAQVTEDINESIKKEQNSFNITELNPNQIKQHNLNSVLTKYPPLSR